MVSWSRTQRTQFLRWDEEYKIPVTTWQGLDKIIVEVCYKGFLVDNTWSSLDINAVRDEGTHFRRLPLRNNKRQYLQLSVAVLKSNVPALSTEDCHLPYEACLSVDEAEPAGYAKVEVIEASDLGRSTFPGLIHPYVMGLMGHYRFRTKARYKTEAWLEEFRVPVLTLREPNILSMEVHDERHSRDNSLGSCDVNIIDAVDGERHDLWLPLQNDKSGRLHIAITVTVSPDKGYDSSSDEEKFDWHDETNDIVQRVSQFPHDEIGNEVWTPREANCRTCRNVGINFIVEDRLPDPISGDVEEGETSTSEGEFSGMGE